MAEAFAASNPDRFPLRRSDQISLNLRSSRATRVVQRVRLQEKMVAQIGSRALRRIVGERVESESCASVAGLKLPAGTSGRRACLDGEQLRRIIDRGAEIGVDIRLPAETPREFRIPTLRTERGRCP